MMQIIITIICTVLASSGFWLLIERYLDRKDVRTKLLIGIGHDRIITLGMLYIERGWITKDEFDNLYDYLYIPYQKAGGNGSATKIIQEVMKLPIKQHSEEHYENQNDK